MIRLMLNGRFLGRPITGVERLALELGRSLRVLLRDLGRNDIPVVVPAGTSVGPTIDELGLPRPTIIAKGRGGGHVWEQTTLAGIDGQIWLLDLCNTGPILRGRQALVICDAQIALHPKSYSWAFRWWYRVLITVASRRARTVFTISEFSKTSLERFRLVPRGKAHVLRLGVDHLDTVVADEAVISRHALADRPFLLAIGSLAQHKNLVTLLDAFAAAELSGIDLVIAGGGNSRVFRDVGLSRAPNIRYTGRVTDGELKALYAHALAFACPSLSEGFGFTPLEAMSMGCPVIATTGGAVPEVCGDAALYADPLDHDAWRDALRRVATDVDLRAQLSGRAKARAGLFRWRDTAQQMLRVLAEADRDAPLLAALAKGNADALTPAREKPAKAESGSRPLAPVTRIK